jgi:GAF domain-containing protein
LLASPQTAPGRLAATKTAVHITDLAADSNYIQARDPTYVTGVELGGVRTLLIVPMLREGELVGSFAVYRQEVRPFADKQIALVTNFAAQAVIAIENARLLNELRQSLEQQTATSEVLQVVSSSPGALQPVFDAMLTNATRLCEASFGILLRYENAAFHVAASHNAPLAFVELRRREPTIRASGVLRRVVATKQLLHISDCLEDASYREGDADFVRFVDLCGARSFIAAPMLKDDELVGAISIYRQEVRPFTDKQIELVKNFAAQAVIAIENTRLLNELRQRTDDLSQRTTDLTESLDQQTATSKVLDVISRSAFDLQAVFETVVESSGRLCGADRAFILRFDGELLRMAASHNATPVWREWVAQHPIRPGQHSASARAALERRTIHIPDVMADPEYTYGVGIESYHTVLAVPIIKGDALLGVLIVYNLEVRPFTNNQIALVETFADQAAIAIENVRLFEAEQQRARDNARLLGEIRERTTEVEKLNQQLEQRVTDQVGEIERMGRLRRFLPPQVADLIVASGTEKQLESHRREITALFCDLRGFTGFTESADAEDVMALLREYHATVGEKIIKYSGTLERYAGDGVMVVFNDPVPVDNPALQAVLMALEMRDAIGALTETWASVGARNRLRHRHCARVCYARHHRLRGTFRLCRHRHGIQRRFAAM